MDCWINGNSKDCLQVMKVATFVVLFISLIVASERELLAQDWPQWRGPNRDGSLNGFIAPKSWPKELKQVWKTPIGSGYSSPVTAQGRVYTHTLQNEREVVSCIDLNSGKILWSKDYPASYTSNQYATSMDKGPRATPLLHAGKLFTLGATTILSCFDAKTGEMKWRKDYSAQTDFSKLFTGAGMSPVIEGGNLIVHVGDDRKGWLIAFDAETGNEKWKLEGDGPGYASPIVVELEGTRQIVTLTDKSAIGVEASSGKLLWSMPFPDEWIENIVTPLVYKKTLILSGVRKSTMAIRVIKNGDNWTTERVWENKDLPMYMSSPVLSGDHLFGFSNRRSGQFFCLDANTGAMLWQTEGRDGKNATLLTAGELLILLTDEGKLTIAKNNPKTFEPVVQYSVGESPTWAHPIFLGKNILIKDNSSLALLSFE